MYNLYTFQDLIKNKDNKISFIESAVNFHKNSLPFRRATEAEKYYFGENPTIMRYEKILYDMQGRAHRDLFSANHKIASSFFGFAVDQQVSYLLGNGITFNKPDTKKALGTQNFPIDRQIMKLARYSAIHGQSFGFWNLDHVEIFRLTEFFPLYDEENGALRAGIRFWQTDSRKPLRVTLYEEDGYTEFIKRNGEKMTVLRPKRKYILNFRTSGTDGFEIYDGKNYDNFPIVPLKNNEYCLPELYGKGRKNTIDALDLATSNMVNNVDEGNMIYWILNNCGGMDDLDDAKFLEKLKMTHVVHPEGDADATAEPRTIEAPFEGTQTTVDMLTRRLYADFQAFDSSAVSAGNQTATAIKASYVPLDLKCDKFECQVTDFLDGILKLAGIDDSPSYTRNQIISKNDEIQAVLLGAQYLSDEYITKKILTILGDSDQFETVDMSKKLNEMGRFGISQSGE